MKSLVVDRRPITEIRADVLVVGGGAAGVATAVTAARQGCNVVLIERYGFCGGGAVAGMSGTVCGLYEATDSPEAPPRQIVYGFAEEFVHIMEQRGGLTGPVRYGKTYTRVHDPLVWREVADALLSQAGVLVIYHSTVTDVLLDGERIRGVQAYTKEGKIQVLASVTIDASGDADVVAMAGFPTLMGDNGVVQNPTMIFRLMDVDVERFRTKYGRDAIMPPDVSARIVECNNHGYRLPRAKIWLFPTPRPGELLCNCTRIIGPDGRELNTIFRRDFTDAEIQGRAQVREYERFFRDHLVGCERSWVNDVGTQVGVRQTRQVVGVGMLSNSQVLAGFKSPDGIARSPWPIELHTGDRPKLEWLLNDYYEVPFHCFVPERGESLLVAGRCLSAEHEAVASARVTAQCFSYGHAVGHAAALSVREKISTRNIEGRDIRGLLNRDDALLD